MLKLFARFPNRFSFACKTINFSRKTFVHNEPTEAQLIVTSLPDNGSNLIVNNSPNSNNFNLERFDSSFDIQLDPFNEHFETDALDIFRPVAKPTFNLASYVNDSLILQQLIRLGVDLSEIEKNRDHAQKCLTLNFDLQVLPYVRFLRKIGLTAQQVGACLTENFDLLDQSIENISVRVEYLKRKKFTKTEIVQIVNRYPKYLNVSIVQVDERLAFYQNELRLKSDQVRQMLIRFPRLVTTNKTYFITCKFAFQEQMGFSDNLFKQILLHRPGFLKRDRTELTTRFEYLSSTMKVTHSQIAKHPEVLLIKLKDIQTRHRYLIKIGRDQFDSSLPCYVSLKAFSEPNDAEFVRQCCHTSEADYDAFLKTQ